MPAPNIIQQLVERFEKNRAAFLSGGYKEARLSAACTPQEQEILRREIEATDTQIDRLVYELDGLTEEEIKIVEEEYDG